MNLGSRINRFYRQKCPSLTADGRYLCYLYEGSDMRTGILLSERIDGEFQEPREIRLNFPKPATTGTSAPAVEPGPAPPPQEDPEIMLGPYPAKPQGVYPSGYIESVKISWDGHTLWLSAKTDSYDIWYAEQK